MANTGWIRSLGTSKREQGIVTPKAPQNQPRHRTFPDLRKPINFFGRWLEAVVDWFKDRFSKDGIDHKKVKQLKTPNKKFMKPLPGRVRTFHRLQS